MALINDTVALTKGLRAEFIRRTMDPAPLALINQLATVVPSTAQSETYAFFDELPQLEELKDQVKYSGFSDGTYAIVNKEFAGGVKAKRSEIMDDQLGIILLRIRQLADRAKKHPLKLLFDLLNNAESATLGLCYDGVAFYSSAHPARGASGQQDNLLDGTGVSVAAIKVDIGSAFAQMRGFLDTAGEPYHETLDPKQAVIVCGPELEQPMLEATSAKIISNTSNVLAGRVGEVIVNQRFTGTNDWDLLYTGDALKPLVIQEREALSFVEQTDGDSDGFDRLIWKWRAYRRGNAGYGMWQNAVRTKNA